MGIVNVTPDSFSDGGRFFDPARALDRARQLMADGADIVDIGGESTRPGAHPVSEADELARVLPLIETLAGEGALVSIDTTKPSVLTTSDPMISGVLARSARSASLIRSDKVTTRPSVVRSAKVGTCPSIPCCFVRSL